MPPSNPGAWTTLAATPVLCPDRSERCFEVRLPVRGHLAFQGHSPHELGCHHFNDGRIEASIDQRVITLRMTRDQPALTHGICRALAILRGQGMSGPLDAGAWTLWPEGGTGDQRSPFSPLHLGAVRFAPAARP